MKKLDTIVEDIYELVLNPSDKLNPNAFGQGMGKHVADMVVAKAGEARVHDPYALHASKIGKNCIRQMWYGQWTPKLAEPLLPHTLVKFTYGDVVEELALDLAIAAGHTVELAQQRIEFPIAGSKYKLSGRIDAIIDGCIVDVKSCSPYSFNDWAGKELTADNDSFGYRWQLHTYARGLEGNDLVVEKDKGYLLLMDKQNGHIGLSWVNFNHKAFELRLKIITDMLGDGTSVPPRNFKPSEKDKLGNEKLPIECSYCDFKRECWKEHDVKGVLRSGRVTWLVSPAEGGKVKLKTGEVVL